MRLRNDLIRTFCKGQESTPARLTGKLREGIQLAYISGDN